MFAIAHQRRWAQGKPAPDLFLMAARKLDVDPADCLVLEDAPVGIQAAISAGMRSFAIPSRETKEKEFPKNAVKLESLWEVLGEIEI